MSKVRHTTTKRRTITAKLKSSIKICAKMAVKLEKTSKLTLSAGSVPLRKNSKPMGTTIDVIFQKENKILKLCKSIKISNIL